MIKTHTYILLHIQQTPVIIAGTKEQQKKYLGRLIEEPHVAVNLKLNLYII